MTYDPTEIFRMDPGEEQLTDEYAQQIMPDPASTEDKSTNISTQPVSTETESSGETITFENGKTYDVADIEYRNGMPFVKPEANAK